MAESLFRRFLEYEHRTPVIITLTIVVGLVAVWPAVDDYIAAGGRRDAALLQLEEAEREIAKQERFQQLRDNKVSELEALEQQAVDERAAQELRNEIIQLLRDTGCTMRSVAVDQEPKRVDWKTNDRPLSGSKRNERGDDTPFELETRSLKLLIAGSMGSIHKFLAGMHKIDRMIHGTAISLKKDNGEQGATLYMDCVLFNLARKAD